MNLLTIKDMCKAYTDKVLFDHVDFSINENEKIGVIGINGTGKSTLLKIVAGLDKPDNGSVVKGNNVHIRYLPQNPEFTPGSTIYEYVISANTTPENEWTIEGDAKTILGRLGFSDFDTIVDKLSGGEKKRVALAGALLAKADILVLDEPTNHLDRWMTQWLENYLKAYRGALVMVTHDRYFLDRVSNRILEIDRGKVYNYQTNYEGFLELKSQREAMADSTQQKRQNIMRRELEWIKRGAKARSTKQRARIDRFNEMKEASTQAEASRKSESAQLSSVYTRMGKKTIELRDITIAFGGRTLINDFSYIFLRGESVAFVGKNGCGKSTLMKIITGAQKPDSGDVEIGDTIRIGYFAQENGELDPTQRVIDCIKDVAEYVQTSDGSVSASLMLERFLFDSTLQYSPIGKLSGGEKRRLYLIKVLMSAPNVLILDEPTNDLDIQTLSILEDYLENFAGITIIVSHDRYFLDRTADRVFVFDESGNIMEEVHQDADAILDKMASSQVSVTQNTGEKSSKPAWNKGERALKFSYMEQKEYDTIEDDIVALEEKIEKIDEDMAKYATDFVKLNELGNEKEETKKKLDEKYARWEYLTELAEKIETSKK
jgi:ABC transport system ATP-binding/permease protein